MAIYHEYLVEIVEHHEYLVEIVEHDLFNFTDRLPPVYAIRES